MKRKTNKLKKLLQTINKYFINWQKCNKQHKKELSKIFLLFLIMSSFIACNVTRKVTTESQYVQKGDTNVVITTKTIETYDASKKF